MPVLPRGVPCLQKVELLYLRAICYHAMGYARKAVADYDACMNCTSRKDEGPVGEESRLVTHCRSGWSDRKHFGC